MGGGNSKKKEEPKPKRLEDEIPVYVRPESPVVQPIKIEGLNIIEDQNLDREAANKELAERQKRNQNNSKLSISQTSPKKQKEPYKIINNVSRIDESFDRGLGQLDANDLKELEFRLQQDDLSPINRSVTESEKNKIDFAKIVKAEKKIIKAKQQIKRAFNLPSKGSVNLISVGFKYGYSWKTQRLAITQPYDNYVNSILKWVKNEQSGVYEFKLRDIDVYNIDTGDVTTLAFNEVEFMVDSNGIFIGLKHENDFLKNMRMGKAQLEIEKEKEEKERQQLLQKDTNNLERLMQQKLKPKPVVRQKKQSAEQVVHLAEKKLEQFWNQSIQVWYTLDESTAKKTKYQGLSCLMLQKQQEETKDKLENFLVNKLQDPAFFKQCFESNKTIRDVLKKWQMFSEEEELAYLHEPKYVIVQLQKRISFPMLSKHTIIEGTLNNSDFTPQIVSVDQCRKTVIEHNHDLFVDVEHEKKLIVFMWDKQMNSKSKVRSESIFVEELNKFRDSCDKSLKETIFQLSVIPNFPMENRPKFKEKYFQIQ